MHNYRPAPLDELQLLARRLEQAVEREDYELAAKTRDEMKAVRARAAEKHVTPELAEMQLRSAALEQRLHEEVLTEVGRLLKEQVKQQLGLDPNDARYYVKRYGFRILDARQEKEEYWLHGHLLLAVDYTTVPPTYQVPE